MAEILPADQLIKRPLRCCGIAKLRLCRATRRCVFSEALSVAGSFASGYVPPLCHRQQYPLPSDQECVGVSWLPRQDILICSAGGGESRRCCAQSASVRSIRVEGGAGAASLPLLPLCRFLAGG